MTEPVYQAFLGTWVLDPTTCRYEQGEPPRADRHRIVADGYDLVITMDSTDAGGEDHHVSFRAPANGQEIPFNAGPLADTLCLTLPSPHELHLAASCDGLELMTATRTLDADGTTLHLVQTVHLPDFTAPANRATYRKVA